MQETDLKAWLKQYITWKDSADKAIKSINETDFGLEVTYEDKKTRYVVAEALSLKMLDGMDFVCVPNTENNLEFLIKNWKMLCSTNLTFLFVNLTLGEKWVLRPKIHNAVCDPEKLEQGLRAMFETANGKSIEVPKGSGKMPDEEE